MGYPLHILFLLRVITQITQIAQIVRRLLIPQITQIARRWFAGANLGEICEASAKSA